MTNMTTAAADMLKSARNAAVSEKTNGLALVIHTLPSPGERIGKGNREIHIQILMSFLWFAF